MRIKMLFLSITLILVSLFMIGACKDDGSRTCAGLYMGGYCWYLGDVNQSCDTFCSTHGGYNEATRTYAGVVTAGNDTNIDNCMNILNALDNGTCDSVSFEGPETGIGCFINIEEGINCHLDPPVTLSSGIGTSVAIYERRVCACNE